LSKASNAKNTNGSSNYYKDIINLSSEYIWSIDHPTGMTSGANAWGTAAVSGKTYTSLTTGVTASLSLGVSAETSLSNGNVIAGFDLFSNDEQYDVSLIPAGPWSNSSVIGSLVALAENRKDCMVFLSPDLSDVVGVTPAQQASNVVDYRNNQISVNSSYAEMDSGWKYQYDRYNDVYRYIPLNGDIAGLCARTDQERDPWFSPGGLNRGIIKNSIKLAFNPTKTERDNLYVQGINPVVTFAGEGTVLFGDKTLLSKPSVFDRINVRRLFIVLEKTIARAARSSLFEFNDQFTRAQFVNLVEPFLRDVQGRRGLTDYRVVCDESNNTANVIDSNQFVGDIYIKPARSVNFIQLNFVAVRTGVSFEEIVGRF
jgi:phage tail sheath protein FI